MVVMEILVNKELLEAAINGVHWYVIVMDNIAWKATVVILG